MNNKRAIGLTPKELNVLEGYFWHEVRRSDFIGWVDEYLGHGAGTGEAILTKLMRAADICLPLGAAPEVINE